MSISTYRDSRTERSAPAATMEGVGFRYPSGTVALEGLDLEIPRGRVTGIVGPSGCGKSTMLQLLSRLAKPTSGTVQLNVARTAERHDVAMVFQQDTLLPWRTVAQNVAVYDMFHRPRDRQASQRRVGELLSMIGLEQFADAYPNQLSGGMRRRTAFVAGVASRPQLLLLDEAFSSVDEPSRVLIHQEVLRIVRELEMTTVLVTHDLAEAISLSDRVCIFSSRPGRVVASYDVPFGEERTMLELREHPDFLELYGALWRDLSAQIEAARAQGDQ